MSYSAKKRKRGTLGDLLTYIQLQNIKKLEWGNHYKVFEKKSHKAKKTQMRDPLGTSGFVGFLEKVKMGALYTNPIL